MKILVVLPRFPYPVLKGDSLRAYYQLQSLGKLHEVHLLCLTEDQQYPQYLPHIQNFCASVQVVEHSWIQKFINLVLAVGKGLPFQVAYFYSPKLKNELTHLITKYNFDVVYVQLIRSCENIPFAQLNVPCMLDYMDAFSAGMLRRAQSAPYFFKPIFKREAKQLQEYETKVFENFAAHSMITTADCESLVLSTEQKAKIQIIPNGVKNSFFHTQESTTAKDIDLIFTGNMNYFPNVEAAIFLVEEIVPLLQSKFPNLTTYLVGANPDRSVKRLANVQTIVTGFVPEILPYLLRAKVFVAPLFYGSGLQNKLLEAMAASLPVVTSPQAQKALGVQPNTVVLEANDAPTFVKQIETLLNAPTYAATIAQAAKEFVQQNYSWEAANQVLQDCLMKIKGKAI